MNAAQHPFIGLDGLVARLKGVRRTGQGRYMARCPTRNDKTPSLSIREADNGSILVHDFGGSDFHEIVAALGLQPIELIPEHLRHARDNLQPTKSAPPIPWRDAFQAIAFQATVVLIAAGDLRQGKALSDTALDQLAHAEAVINNALATCRGGRT